jgi:hypothetical protein
MYVRDISCIYVYMCVCVFICRAVLEVVIDTYTRCRKWMQAAPNARLYPRT